MSSPTAPVRCGMPMKATRCVLQTGCAQIGRISTMLDGVEVGAAFSCPTTQCVGTSEGIAGEKRGSIRTLEDLRNRELGAWEGQEWSEVRRGAVTGSDMCIGPAG